MSFLFPGKSAAIWNLKKGGNWKIHAKYEEGKKKKETRTRNRKENLKKYRKEYFYTASVYYSWMIEP